MDIDTQTEIPASRFEFFNQYGLFSRLARNIRAADRCLATTAAQRSWGSLAPRWTLEKFRHLDRDGGG